ncbi:hypothetical protein ECTPHS_13999 [Ectothiorhodospira sp. PHS-1]|nr:hypothetical protein ECTPHS_13999 [Ectothiorhodospira sp. PHS-1]
MRRAGQIALMPFPYTDLTHSKKRPVLLLRRLDHHDAREAPGFSYI